MAWASYWGVLVFCIIILYYFNTKHIESKHMKSSWLQEQPSVENIQEELTVQDISLRQAILKNSSRTSKRAELAGRPTGFESQFCTPLRQQSSSTSSVAAKNCKINSFWFRSAPSSSVSKRSEVKIHSLVYGQRSQYQPSISIQKKNKLSVSLSLKSRDPKSKDFDKGERDKVRLKQRAFIGDKENWKDDKSFEIKLDKKEKEVKELKPQESVVRIKQPDFHSRHPLREEGRLNGCCLSRIIVQRTMQPKNF